MISYKKKPKLEISNNYLGWSRLRVRLAMSENCGHIRHGAAPAAPREGFAIASQVESSEAVDLGPLGQLVGYYLRRASAALNADFAASVEGTGMRQVLFGILSVISANPGINQGNVARVLGVQRTNMVALVNELIARGLVGRTVDREDRRAFALNLTLAGEAMVAETLARIRVHEERMLNGVSARERATLIRLLGRMAGNGE